MDALDRRNGRRFLVSPADFASLSDESMARLNEYVFLLRMVALAASWTATMSWTVTIGPVLTPRSRPKMDAK